MVLSVSWGASYPRPSQSQSPPSPTQTGSPSSVRWFFRQNSNKHVHRRASSQPDWQLASRAIQSEASSHLLLTALAGLPSPRFVILPAHILASSSLPRKHSPRPKMARLFPYGEGWSIRVNGAVPLLSASLLATGIVKDVLAISFLSVSLYIVFVELSMIGKQVNLKRAVLWSIFIIS